MPPRTAFIDSHPSQNQPSCPSLDVPSKRTKRIPTACAQLRAVAEERPARSEGRWRSIFKEVDVDGFMDQGGGATHVASAMPDTGFEDYFHVRHNESSRQARKRLYLSEDMKPVPVSRSSSALTRMSVLAILMVIMMPLMYDIPLLGKPGPSIIGAKAALIRPTDAESVPSRTGPIVAKRSDTATDVCNRWSQQSALVNGTIYLYGGHASHETDQTDNTWTNDFLSLDITKNFNIDNVPFKGLPQPSGVPAVSNGFLWQSYDTLYLYGGEVSSSPRAFPTDYSLWTYDIKTAEWNEHSNPKTSAGNYSDGGGQPVQQAAEGAGISIPTLGRGYYFAGHLDPFTTSGWALPVPRVYLKSLIEYTFPGYTNDAVESLTGGKTAGTDGVWRNITQAGIQDTGSFTNRADSALVYVPGFGADGILVSLGGGTNMSFVGTHPAVIPR